MKRYFISVCCLASVLCFFSSGPRAEPGFISDLLPEVLWADGPEGAFRPLAGGGIGETFVVDGVSGSDEAAGTEEFPFATIAKALELAGAGDIITVRAGLYHEQIRPDTTVAAPTRARPLIIQAEPADGISVVLDGTDVACELEGGLDHPAGVSLHRDSYVTLRGFRIQHWGGYGVALQQGSGCRVEDCSFADNGLEMADAVHLVLLSAQAGRVLNNRFEGGAERCLDDRATDSWILGNHFTGCSASAIKAGPHPAGAGGRIEHNVFTDNPATQGVVHLDEVHGLVFSRNLIVNGNLAGLVAEDLWQVEIQFNTITGLPYGMSLGALSDCKVHGNLLTHNTVAVEFLANLTSGTLDGNLYFGNTADADGTGAPGEGAIFADPLFGSVADDDYRLDAGSPAENAGPADLPVPEGGGSRVDLGAFERGAGEAPWAYQVGSAVADASPGFVWTYVDADGPGVQRAYRVQVDRRPDFDSGDLLDSNWQETAESTWTVPHDFELDWGRWYVRVRAQDAAGQAGPWSDPHWSVDVVQPSTCGAQGGMGCAALDACIGSWLVAADENRCCEGDCAPCPDADSDGYLDASCGGADCDDADGAVHPGAEENCENGIDDDCNGQTDLSDAACGCVDHDRDGYGEHCELGPDCDDGIASVHPGAEELCNYVDDDCDGEEDEGFDLNSDPAHCGECNWACGQSQVCDLGDCADACGGGRSECHRACVDLSSDMMNCGACDEVCDLLQASETCSDGVCVLTLCEAGYVDANGNTEDGCELACTAGEEICDNGLDDDCDGQVDEDCGGGGGGCTSAGIGRSALAFFLLLGLALMRRNQGL
ncbi:MAG: right-handed parallel beta-helix repeat-containing protein [Deltaproteobacteria bacterium]|nr:right-handed parallel beta-helix repeat-containing protein [Deltaproteobacteria bacterium]